MIQGYSSISQAIFGTLFTWFLTAAGSALVFVFKPGQRKVLDGSLGFAAGVMLAASYWSLLAPAIEMASNSELYGSHAYLPVALGFGLGAFFVYFADVMLQKLGTPMNVVAMLGSNPKMDDNASGMNGENYTRDVELETGSAVKRRFPKPKLENGVNSDDYAQQKMEEEEKILSWKRIILLIIAITIHNVPEGLAVGVGFGAIGKTQSATFESARNLAIGIGIQNFPEGLAVSLPLRGAGISVWQSFWYGQLSGMVEPIAGILGALAVTIAEPVLPYALAFAAGAMVFVVNDDIIPEAQMCGNGKLASLMSIVGFIVMMALDVGLG
uniref:Zinc transporter ZIP11 n=1 Tax=Ciona intestinalis TaxID=7719 RepID=H2XN47_CIOIN|nr:zinc transporter ZIP11 [Ciona intestinalis]|eukprot:XP_002132021.2 zinc transporter ZIP11 [Ciona intestinalis]